MSKCVYIVDDDRTLTEYATLILQTVGYDAVSSWSVEEAKSFILSGNIAGVDLIIVDLDLNGESGLSLVELIKSVEQTAHIPVIVLSECHTEKLIIAAFGVGATDFIPKPFSRIEFLARVNMALAKTNRRKSDCLVKLEEMEERTRLLERKSYCMNCDDPCENKSLHL